MESDRWSQIYAGISRTCKSSTLARRLLSNKKDNGPDEMLRLQGLCSNTPTGVPYTEDEIMAIVCGGTFPVLDGFCQDRARLFLPHLKAPPHADILAKK
ncbi:hypothetical protein Tco_0627413 [Tanacetum coccineum]|uniref:Uncharacterized protein n=1 Tax=Tanacetum coccineum TaxID=301880 RepID=A0ABQ4WMF8_9ASTR